MIIGTNDIIDSSPRLTAARGYARHLVGERPCMAAVVAVSRALSGRDPVHGCKGSAVHPYNRYGYC